MRSGLICDIVSCVCALRDEWTRAREKCRIYGQIKRIKRGREREKMNAMRIRAEI